MADSESTTPNAHTMLLTNDSRADCIVTAGTNEAISTLIGLIAQQVFDHVNRHYNRRVIHQGLHTGQELVDHLLLNHGDDMHARLGVYPKTFRQIVIELDYRAGIHGSRHVSAPEQLAIFLHVARHGSGVRYTGSVFSWSLETVSTSFHRMLNALSSPPMYTHWVRQPTASSPVPIELSRDARFARHFEACVGAIDGTHLPAHVPAAHADRFRSRKGHLSFNVLAVCTFDLKFSFILAGYEGSAPDSTVFAHALLHGGLQIPEGRWLLADAGYGLSDKLMTPYGGVRYHLKEWEKARRIDQHPKTYKELYNLRHAGARNAIERIFGVVKRKWKILPQGCEYGLEDQARDAELEIKDSLPSNTRVFDGRWRDIMEEGEARERNERARSPLGLAVDGLSADRRRDDLAKGMYEEYKRAEQARRRRNLN